MRMIIKGLEYINRSFEGANQFFHLGLIEFDHDRKSVNVRHRRMRRGQTDNIDMSLGEITHDTLNDPRIIFGKYRYGEFFLFHCFILFRESYLPVWNPQEPSGKYFLLFRP